VLNRPGAGGTIAAAAAAKAAPDGYTILQGQQPTTPSAKPSTGILGLRPGARLQPRRRFASAVYIVVAHPRLGVRTLGELIQKAKAGPGKLNYASAHWGRDLHRHRSPESPGRHRHGPQSPNTAGGRRSPRSCRGVTEVYGSPYATAKPFVDDGKLVCLAVTSAERISYIPDTPTVAETLPGYDGDDVVRADASRGTAQAVRDKIQSAAAQAIGMAETTQAPRGARLCDDQG